MRRWRCSSAGCPTAAERRARRTATYHLGTAIKKLSFFG
jgi:hypothetical protein